MVNWTAVAIGFVATIVLETIGIIFKSLDASVAIYISIFAPVIGGFIAAYWAGGIYKEGAINGGLAGGIGSLIAAIIFIPGNLSNVALNAVISFVSSGILGIIGGLIGILSGGNNKERGDQVKKEDSQDE